MKLQKKIENLQTLLDRGYKLKSVFSKWVQVPLTKWQKKRIELQIRNLKAMGGEYVFVSRLSKNLVNSGHSNGGNTYRKPEKTPEA